MKKMQADPLDVLPNFFIVGAPKCGTTALSEYLRAHPNVYMSQPKEPHYFAGDISNPDSPFPIRGFTELEDYLGLFRGAGAEHSIRGEASVWYLYSSVAASCIREMSPDSSIVVMVRNPVEMVYSLHAQLLYTHIETEIDFERAWRLQDERRNCMFLQYGEIGKLGAQVRRLLSVFPAEQVKVVVFDDFRSSTQLVYHDILTFLRLRSDDRAHFPRVNENKRNRSNWLARFISDTPAPLYSAANGVKRLFGISELGILERLHGLNTEVRPRPEMSAAMRDELASFFRDDVALLGELLGRDLSHWTLHPRSADE